MSMQVTRCPHCRTSFRVRAEQLNVAGGAVRCGSCLQVFKAAEHFITNEEQAKSGFSTSRSTAMSSATPLPLAETTTEARPTKSNKVLQFTLPPDDEDEDLDKVLSSSANAEDAALFDLADIDTSLKATPEMAAEDVKKDVFSAHDQSVADTDPVASRIDEDIFSAISDDMDDPFGDDDEDANIAETVKPALPPVVDPRINKIVREGDILIHDNMDLDDFLIEDDTDTGLILNDQPNNTDQIDQLPAEETSEPDPERFDDFNAATPDDELDQSLDNATELARKDADNPHSKNDSVDDFDFLLDEIAQEAADNANADSMFFESSGSSPAHAMIDFDEQALEDDAAEDILNPIDRYNSAKSATDDADSWALNLLLQEDDKSKSPSKHKGYMNDMDSLDDSVFDDLDAPFNRQQSALTNATPHVDEYHTQGIDDDDLDQDDNIEEIDHKDDESFQLGGDIELASQSLEFDLPPSLANLNVPSNSQKVRRNGLWAFGVLALAFAMIAQVAYFRFDTGARSATWRPMYAQVCAWLECQLPSLQNVRNMATQHLVVRPHPDLQNALVVDTLLINNASQQQPFPDLVLEFKDLNDTVLASRRFKPSEYLAGELAGEALMPAGIPIHIGFEIVHPGAEAVSYQIRILANQ